MRQEAPVGADEMAQGKTKTQHVGFRCPEDLAAWVEQLSGAGATRTDAYVWVISLGRDVVEAGGPDFARKLDGYAAVLGIERQSLLRRVLESGMASIAKDVRASLPGAPSSKKPA